MNTYFKTDIATYEQIRCDLDAAKGYPNDHATTSFAPVAEALKDQSGFALIGAIPEIASAFRQAGAQQITEDEYRANLPTLESLSITPPLPPAL
jgi:hypothetical protein